MRAEEKLDWARNEGLLVISGAAFAEVVPAFLRGGQDVNEFLAATAITLTGFERETLVLAGTRWDSYRQRRPARIECPACGEPNELRCARCGRGIVPRQHIVADFLIGAHALLQADRLLTRDRGFYATYFPERSLL